MRWHTNREGEIRTRRIFAWLPIECSDGTTRWLERVTVTERYVQLFASPSFWDVTCAEPREEAR